MASVGRKRDVSLWVAIVVTAAIAFAVIYLRLVLFREHLLPLAYGIPLLICLWHGRAWILWAMAILFSAALTIEIFWIGTKDTADVTYRWIAFTTALVNIWITASVILLLLRARQMLVLRNEALEASNAELESANEELTAREEEIRRQNEELQSQAEELEQQSASLQESLARSARQQEQLQILNDELLRRERAMEILLESAKWLTPELEGKGVMSRICDAALQVLEDAVAAVVVERRGDRLMVRGHSGFGRTGPVKRSWSCDQSFASVVMQENRTAYLEDIALRPDLEVPMPADGRILRSVLASPLRVDDTVIGVIKVYSTDRREWTEEQFRIVEWLAAQSSLLLEAAKLQQELDQRRREAEDASIRKTRFLAAVSHDVRTPANAISLLAELISRSAADPAYAAEVPELARDLKVSAQSLVELVSDVLDLARYDSGRLDVQISRFPLWQLIDGEVHQLLPLAQAKGLILSAQNDAGDLILDTDRMKLARVLKNVVGNAIKFTDRGSVEVTSALRVDGDIEISVNDTGIGISREHQAHIFDEFFQLRNPERDRSKGSGLGLAICRRLVEAIGASLQVESTPGEGSVFRLVMPASLRVLEGGSSERGGNGESECVHNSLVGVRILLVEDHQTTRVMTSRLLAQEGAVVLEAGSGSQALEILEQDTPQVVLLDLMLPDMDGSEIIRAIRKKRPDSLRCVFAVSGDVTAARLEELRTLGVDEVMSKPIDINRLVLAIKGAPLTMSQTPGASTR